MSHTYMRNLAPEALIRYKKKLGLIGLEKCPYSLTADSWLNNPKQWPSLHYGNLYSYLIRTPGVFTEETMANFKALDAFRFFMDGWVQTIYHQHVTSTHILLQAEVTPSWRINDEKHKPWLVLHKDGQVLAAHCNCKAGLGESCSHVGAMLYKIEAAVRLKYTTDACTDVACRWNNFSTKKVQPASISKILFYRNEAAEKAKSCKRMRKAPPPKSSPQEEQQFLLMLDSTGLPLTGLSSYAQYNERFRIKAPPHPSEKLPQTLRKLYKEEYGSLNPKQVRELCSGIKVSVTQEQINYLEEMTHAQSSSSLWHDHRTGRITSSVSRAAMVTSPVDPAPSLISKICTPNPTPLRTDAIEWGKTHEKDAFSLYKFLTAKAQIPGNVMMPSGKVYMLAPLEHQNLEVTEAGFRICFDFPMLGGTSDGTLKCDCCGKGVLEIKCPYTQRDIDLSIAVSAPDFFLDKNMSLRPNHEYYAQVQHQMFVYSAFYADFVTWTPREVIISRVARDDDFINAMVLSHRRLWRMAILPELLTRKLEMKQVQEMPSEKDPPNEICPCGLGEENGEEMLGCDSCDQFFHLPCLKRKRAPPKKQNWYCKMCKKKKAK